MGVTKKEQTIEESSEFRLMLLMQRLWQIPDGGFQKDQFELTLPQVRMIVFVKQHHLCHMQEIADGLGLSPPTVSVSIRKLVEGGWLERRPDPDDGRAICLSLTKKSDQVVKQALNHQKKIGKMFISGLSAAEQDLLLTLLEKGIISIENHVLKQ